MSISRSSAPEAEASRRALVSVRSVVPKPGRVTARIPRAAGRGGRRCAPRPGGRASSRALRRGRGRRAGGRCARGAGRGPRSGWRRSPGSARRGCWDRSARRDADRPRAAGGGDGGPGSGEGRCADSPAPGDGPRPRRRSAACARPRSRSVSTSVTTKWPSRRKRSPSARSTPFSATSRCAAEDHVGGRLVDAGVGVDVRGEGAARLLAHQLPPVVGLGHEVVRGREVEEDGGPRHRVAAARRDRGPEVLADLDREDDAAARRQARTGGRGRKGTRWPATVASSDTASRAEAEPALLVVLLVVRQEALGDDAQESARSGRGRRR